MRGDVDQQVGLRQAQIEHRPERLPAGQQLHPIVARAQPSVTARGDVARGRS